MDDDLVPRVSDELWKLLNQHQHNKNALLGYLRQIVVPFGKYEGSRFEDIPMRYLDETIAIIVPQTFLPRMAARFVTEAMLYLYQLRCTDDIDPFTVPTFSLCHIEQRFLRSAEEY